MELKFTKTDEKVMEITFPMYMRGYSFADSFDILNGMTLEEVLARRINEDVVATNKHIKSTVGICQYKEQDYLSILNSRIPSDIEKIITNLRTILDILGKIKNPSKKTKDLYGKLRNNIKEIQSLLNHENSNFEIPVDFRTNSSFYQIMQSQGYKKLKKSKLDGEMLNG